jgi:hypothetical protein
MAIPFDVNDAGARDALLRRGMWDALDRLREDAPPRWGRMSARQMVEHLSWTFAVSTGQAFVACATPEAKRDRYKTFLRDDTPMPREFRNPALISGLPPLRHEALASALTALRGDVERFLDQCRDAPEATATHPTFGPLGAEEWSRSHYKHVHHHLLQFGLVEGGPAGA